MSSDPNTNDEDSTPLKRPKSQPSTVAKEISEVDFWDLDEESPANPSGAPSLPPPRQKSILPRHPAKKRAAIPKVTPEEKIAKPIAPETPKSDVSTKRSFPKSDTAPKASKRYPSASSDVFSSRDLESSPIQKQPEPLKSEEKFEEAEAIPVPPPVEETFKQEVGFSPPADTAASKETLHDLKKKWNLTQIEKIGLSAFLVLLLGTAAFFLTQGVYKLPEEPKLLGSGGFPVTGQMFTIADAETFWRKPITEGTRPDRVRRGTQLIPVLKISLTQGKGAIRVLFRNAERGLVGDGITHAVQGNTTLEIPATAGFEEMGMHAAYRTNENKPWNVEVLEAPSTESPTSQFKKIYEAHISAEQR